MAKDLMVTLLEKEKNAGSGLLNMRHRAKLLGATFTIQSKPGTSILMTIPI